ncbi:MAG TPA: ester cyclase [Actinophytocola sp.]|uniref:ester cyclase n=1 Tax=Actinophytocola sp. TaxID=1872138 RepID=UPI002DDD9A8A|nr:ester cyclase [Actinophytocola sp.]HEV2778470.1 ester cyclase [Actinophytocola sp.]
MTPAERAAAEIFEIFTSGDYERIRDLVTDDFVDHGAPPGLPPGPDGYIGVLRFLKEVMRIRYEVHDVVAAGDKVAIRATVHGVHNTDHLGVAATGKPYAMHTMHLYRAEGDRLAEHWGVRDEHGVLVQVGALPAPTLPSPLAVRHR